MLADARLRSFLWWLPLFVWLALEICLLAGALAVPCGSRPGGDRTEVFLLMSFASFPASILVAVVPESYYFNFCRPSGCVRVLVSLLQRWIRPMLPRSASAPVDDGKTIGCIRAASSDFRCTIGAKYLE